MKKEGKWNAGHVRVNVTSVSQSADLFGMASGVVNRTHEGGCQSQATMRMGEGEGGGRGGGGVMSDEGYCRPPPLATPFPHPPPSP